MKVRTARGFIYEAPFSLFLRKMLKILDKPKSMCYYMCTERTLGDQGLQGVPFMELPISFLGYGI